MRKINLSILFIILLFFLVSSCSDNPVNPVQSSGTTSKIRISIPAACYVDLNIYDVTGFRVFNLLSKQLSAGVYEINWVAQQKGVFFANIKATSIISGNIVVNEIEKILIN